MNRRPVQLHCVLSISLPPCQDAAADDAFNDLAELTGGLAAWQAAKLPSQF
jgi:hypothetical protein